MGFGGRVMATGGVRAGLSDSESLMGNDAVAIDAGAVSGAARQSVLDRIVPETLETIFDGIETGDVDPDVLATLAMAEFGVGQGETFQSLLAHSLEHGVELYGIDAFAGKGDRAAFHKRFGLQENVKLLAGIAPSVLGEFPGDVTFAFVHVNGGEARAALDAMAFAWQRLVSGGILVITPAAGDDAGVTNFAKSHGLGSPTGTEANMAWFRKG